MLRIWYYISNCKTATKRNPSPIKNSKRSENIDFFSGLFSDSKGCKRLISFVPKLRAPLDKSMTEKKTISAVGCQVRETSVGDSKLALTKYSKVQPSPRKFDAAGLMTKSEVPVIHIEDLCSLTIQKVTFTVKVSPPETVKNRHGKELKKQDRVVGDSTGCDIEHPKEKQPHNPAGTDARPPKRELSTHHRRPYSATRSGSPQDALHLH